MRVFPGPRLCPTCGFAMDPALAGVDRHMSCEANPGAVESWRRRGAQKLTPAQLAGNPVPNPGPDTTEETP